MKGLSLSRAASGLVRSLMARAGCDRDRILLSDIRSVDWQSLTFNGERHVLTLRLTGNDSAAIAARVTDGLGEAEFDISGHIVADIAPSALQSEEDGSVSVVIEALTLCA